MGLVGLRDFGFWVGMGFWFLGGFVVVLRFVGCCDSFGISWVLDLWDWCNIAFSGGLLFGLGFLGCGLVWIWWCLVCGWWACACSG